jgi:hypothetical protein
MLSLTPFERAIQRVLVDHVRSAQGKPEKALITYGELGALLAPIRRDGDPAVVWPFHGFFEAIGHVSMYEVEHGRAMLSAIVVNTDTRMPGEGFSKLARHLGFDVVDDREFWEQEVEEILDLWSRASDAEILDRAIEVLDERLRAIQRALRRRADADGPYLARTVGLGVGAAAPHAISVTNVGTRPAVEAMYVGRLPSGLKRTDIFHVRAGETVEVPLLRAHVTYNADVMGPFVADSAEILVFGDGTGRWFRIRPHLGQKPDVWTEGSTEIVWHKWYRDVLNYEASLPIGAH